MKMRELIIGSRGVSFSSDLLVELCGRGIRVARVTSGGKPFALITSPMLTATVETRRQQMAAYFTDRGAEFCRWIVAGKLRNQERLLRYFAKSREGTRREELESVAKVPRKLRRAALEVEGSSADAVRPKLLGQTYSPTKLFPPRRGLKPQNVTMCARCVYPTKLCA